MDRAAEIQGRLGTAFKYVSLVIIGALLVFQHRVIRPYDLSHIDLAFFHANSAISILLFLGILGDELWR